MSDTQEKENVNIPMVCACGSSAAEAEKLRKTTLQMLEAEDWNIEAELDTTLIYALDQEGVWITGVVADQWMAVTAQDDKRKYWVPADRLTDALCALYRYVIYQRNAETGCCSACDGTGAGVDGPCWDCRGTGHPHEGECNS